MNIMTRSLALLAVAAFVPVASSGGIAHPADAPVERGGSFTSPGAQVTDVTALTGARIIDGTGGPVIEDGVVVIRDRRIEAAGHRDDIEIPDDAEVVDLDGRWLLPGFINAHGHVSGSRASMLSQLEQYAYYGVTTVVSLGGNEAEGFPLREEQLEEEIDRARIFLSGPVISPQTAAQARTEVQRVADMGADWVKIRVDGGLGGGAKMSPEVYRTVISEARDHGLPVAIHIWELEDAKGVVEAGGALVAHSVRDGPVDRELIDLMLDRDVCLVPTFTREVSTFVYADRPDFFDDPFFLERAAPDNLDSFLTPNLMQMQSQSAGGAFWREALPVARENMRILHEAGVGIAMGTDSGAPTGRWEGYFEHVEMEMMVEGGLSPADVVYSATGGAARCTGLEGELGTIEPGAWADLLVLDADPTVDIMNTREIHSVWISGNRVR
jgi:imidazolonepropionase-like amidohydrolase